MVECSRPFSTGKGVIDTEKGRKESILVMGYRGRTRGLKQTGLLLCWEALLPRSPHVFAQLSEEAICQDAAEPMRRTRLVEEGGSQGGFLEEDVSLREGEH